MGAIIKLHQKPTKCFDCPMFRPLFEHGATVNLCNAEMTRTDPYELPDWCPIEESEDE